ncbi:hypothetical protein [uncultured Sphingomonas sp.]|uniref:hypothetical protein n=1 Tax=uncultured Sphingomonas sp. TaxID=158754 RepID=UPI002637EB1D|nr:hypothetical protein [uncultured Sphingomonas sp.]
MPVRPSDLVSRVSILMCQPIMAAIASENTVSLKPIGGLPAPCFQLPDLHTIIAATPVNAIDIFRAEAIVTAVKNGVDVALIRHGMWPETIDEVSVDVVLGRSCPVFMLWHLFPYLTPNGGYWLVPPKIGAGPSVMVDEQGLSPSAIPPYHDADERAAGVGRAARETVLAVRRLRRS